MATGTGAARFFTPRRLFALAFAASVFTWIMLLIGGTVNPTGSSLACKDWSFTWGFIPQCNGDAFPSMTNGVQFEHGHRLWGWLVGFTTTIIAIWGLVDKTLPKRTRVLAVVAVFLVLVQGALGGITVLLKLDPIVSTGHLVLGYLFLAYMIHLTLRLQPTRRDDPAAGARLQRGFVAFGFTLALAQVALGGAMRHYGAGMICGDDWIGCGAEGFWPSLGLAKLHMTHRVMGYLVLIAAIWVSARARRRAVADGRGFAARLAWVPGVLAVVQVVLGLLTVATGKSVVIVALHTAIGGLVLASFATLFFAFGPLGDPAQRRPVAGPSEAPPRGLEAHA
ncbi:MAG: COX15/CtaA family protein [Myxococcales bacterium]|nr:COX15/CtaA family protein [Myxococcales bacterium]MCB9734115.1 COX15/CtaA family protein [Deltaproteobacteria bacterium]